MVLQIGEQEEKIALAQANRAPFQLDIAVSANDQHRLVIRQYPGADEVLRIAYAKACPGQIHGTAPFLFFGHIKGLLHLVHEHTP